MLFSIFQSFLLHKGSHYRTKKEAATAFFGSQCCNHLDDEPALAHVAKYFEGRISAEELLRRHTLSSLYDAGRPQSAPRLRWAAVAAPKTWAAAFRGIDRLRTCPGCIRGDLETYGFAYYRATHQWYGLRLCTVHWMPLELSRSTCCGLRNMPHYRRERAWRCRPESPCPFCGSCERLQLQVPQGLGYRMYCDVVDECRWGRSRVTLEELAEARALVSSFWKGKSEKDFRGAFLKFFGLTGEDWLPHLFGPSVGVRPRQKHPATCSGDIEQGPEWALAGLAFYRGIKRMVDEAK